MRSDGSYRRDYFYVEDAVQAYLRLAERLDRTEIRGEAFNFSTESHVTVRQIVQTLQSLMGAEDLPPVVLEQAKGEIRTRPSAQARPRDVLGWSAKYGLVDGLKQTIAWYRTFLDLESRAREV